MDSMHRSSFVWSKIMAGDAVSSQAFLRKSVVMKTMFYVYNNSDAN